MNSMDTRKTRRIGTRWASCALLLSGLNAWGCTIFPGHGDVGFSDDSDSSDLDVDLGVGGSADGLTFEPLAMAIESAPALPLTNGTLESTPNGETLVASDAEGHAVYLVQAAEPNAVTKVALGDDEAPGRLVASASSAFVLLRKGSELVVIDLAEGKESARLEVCPSPQGLTLDGDMLHVVCRDGQLVSFSATTLTETRRLTLDDDLRDVVVRNGLLVVSRFRAAELLLLDADGAVQQRLTPDPLATAAIPTLAWRLRVLADGRLLLGHQLSATATVATASLQIGSYGGFGCGSIAAPVLSIIDPDAPEPSQPLPVDHPNARYTTGSATVTSGAGTFDFAVLGDQVNVVFPGNALQLPAASDGLSEGSSESRTSNMTLLLAEFFVGSCVAPFGSFDADVPVAVTTLGNTALFATLTRSPARIKLNSGAVIELHDEPRNNTGLRLFQMNTGAGIACASCHPDGREDGHIWNFEDSGLRRTQSLEGGVTDRAPFHWDGEFEALSPLMDVLMTRRMGLGFSVTKPQVENLQAFLDTLPQAPHPASAAAAEHGQELFAGDLGCSSCHSGEDFSDCEAHDVGTGGAFVTPPLRGAGVRAPFLHDGCAETLAGTFGRCGGGDDHGKADQLSASDRADLLAYLETL